MRFNIFPLLRGHWRGLTVVNKVGEHAGADVLTRLALVVLSSGAAAWVWFADVRFAAPAALLSGFALLSGVLLSVFAQLASMRVRLTDAENTSNRRRVLKDSLDESVAHVLIAAILGLVASVTIVISMAMYRPELVAAPNPKDPPVPVATDPVIAGWPAAVVSAVGVYEVLLLLMIMARLYSAYTRVNDVSDLLDGHKAHR
ncbi:membrane protein [Gordonia phage PCoral7]|uniref:Uncharacterized protein n=1 Tax=Gordonia phage Toast TaxID=2599852 RepID=A0A5J6TB40_9CAUD|nr:hypothetical protein JZX81_gp41 [Gordonia phage Toast]QFG08101.1 hypothetical protein PBI_TOAST_41 [Gordonia phage Toast]UVF60549.1 membrane protein [Gordonia phage PCoral7]